MKHIDELTELPEVGRYYLVPTVAAELFGRRRHWPVIGPKHNDREFLGFEAQHYHLDGRFLSDGRVRLLQHATGLRLERLVASFAVMLNLGELRYARRRCHRVEATYNYPGHMPTFANLWAAYAGQTCDRDAQGGIVCPHRRAPLGSLVAHDGVIRCPLHGLRINASTGVVLATAEGGAERV